ncbi:MAG: Nif3-like dinuclear metal center hexameric protein [Clostridia bacterium]|nr:Nif3-like dinuclear metal center hexameric protein [Clostridia bacterium]
MVKFCDITGYMNEFCPRQLAFDGDNVGLIVGTDQKKVSKVLITLDVDEKVAVEAKNIGADAIISHHPLMFRGTKRLTDADPMERTLVSLIQNDISLFSAHTNLDCAKGGLNDYLAKKLGIKDTSVIEVVANINGADQGFGRLGTVDDGICLMDMLSRCTSVLPASFVKYVGDLQKPIKTVAVNCGGGADEIGICIQKGVDLFITGDVKYNPARDCMESGMALIDAGHYETEFIVCELLLDKLSQKFPDVEFVISKENIPVFNVYHK